MKLILLRHGETEWNREWRVYGRTDVALTEEGRRQALALALALKGEPLEAIYASPLSRTRETAGAIAQFHPLEVRLEEGLVEMDWGECEGLTIKEFRDKYGSFTGLADEAKLPLGEGFKDVQGRAWAAVERFQALHYGNTVLAVTHALVIVSIIHRALGLELGQLGRMAPELGSKTVLEFDGRGPRLTLFNDTCSLGLEDKLKRGFAPGGGAKPQ